MTKRILIALSLLLLPLAAAAQNNEIGGFITTSQFENDSIEDAGDIFDAEFDEDMGFGVMYNRFWMGGLSTEFAYQQIGADLTLSAEDISADVAELDLDILSGTLQFHFARGSTISPYIGAGLAYVSGEAGAIDEQELEDADLESEVELLANAGITLNLGRGFGIFLDGKYIMYEARDEGQSEDEGGLDINPLILAGGLKFRF